MDSMVSDRAGAKQSAAQSRGGEPLLAVNNVGVRFGGIIALDDISFDLPEGMLLGLIGPNGAGKTTLFNCLSRLYTPAKGDILFNGRSILGLPAHKICDIGIARTFQNLALFPRMSVFDNVRVGGHRKSRSDFFSDALRLPHVRRQEDELAQNAEELIDYFDLKNYATRGVAGLMVDALDQVADSGSREAALVHFVERVGADEAAALRRALAELESKHRESPPAGDPGTG